ncbi:sterol desaturase family protein [Dyadobacter chenwenxiniae]|uniref:Sterol desaturase family protein n=1 Tax=Dyadobacter chenwenxiniae TaxID=2906456 RepID=A0A9X1PP71_9BACT|nr:sterol desaturase family protein [Dyadobacter chenwenxiniae]MCF0063614.1 sterol desaturase family protein [Dyadobacter chenwenxiniae]UON83290.1 sterol desaturase family protein [Dyadobacter chenwenxiniae]
MAKNYVSNSKGSSRMFKNNLLESLSKVHFSVPLFIFIPVIVYFSWKSLQPGGLVWYDFVLTVLGGLFVWTFTEYFMHRFVFHFSPKGKWMERIHFIFHGVHHDYPNDSKRLVMPPSVSIPLATGFYFLFAIFMDEFRVAAFFSGFMTGYLFYDMSHYALHHANFKSPFWKKLKKHHMEHHYADSEKGYGVSSDFWDRIFKTKESKREKAELHQT